MHDLTTARRRFNPILLWVLICFFLSGMTGLMYQLLWTRMIVKIIGGAPFAVTIILTVFMGGLGLGSFLAGRWVDRLGQQRQLLRLYGALEIAIALYALAIPALLHVFRPAYVLVYNELAGQFLLYHLLTFAGCTLLLLFPVICMGATLPVLCRFYVSALHRLGTHTGRLYGLNTIGAAFGALVCGFWLISLLGMWGTLIVAVVANAAIGLSCLLASLRMNDSAAGAGAGESPAGAATERIDTGEQASPATIRGALFLIALSGFCAMAYEVIWTRLLGLIVGPTTYSFTIVLVSFIAGLAIGSAVFGWLADRSARPFFLLILTQVVAALSALAFSQIIGNSQLFFAKLIFTLRDNFGALSSIKALILFGFMLLPTICLGAAFPLVAKICTPNLLRVGRSIGVIYAINTVGAVLGSFTAGFVLIPVLGKERSISLVVAAQLLAPLVITAVVLLRSQAPRLAHVVVGAGACLGLVACLFFPAWDRHMLAEGKYHRFEDVEHVVRSAGWWQALFRSAELLGTQRGSQLVFYGDGVGGFTTVLKDADAMGRVHYRMANSGKIDASTGADMATQTLSAHLPMLLHPDARDVLVLGLASGITAGEVLHYPVERLDIIEINNQVVEGSRHFAPWNNNVLTDSRSTLIVQDGRAHFQLTRQTYDVIISEPSNPWMAGLAALFTRECFAAARDRLEEGGIFVQFMHAYQMDWPTFALVGRTFAAVFPNGILVETRPAGTGGDFLLIGFKADEQPSLDSTAARIEYAHRSKNVRLEDAKLLNRLIVADDLGSFFGTGPVNTDQWPHLEFSAPRLMHRPSAAVRAQIEARRLLRPETMRAVQAVTNDVAAQIAFAAFALSVHEPFADMVNIAKASASQRERFYRLVEQYGAANSLEYALLGDAELEARCRAVQIRTLEAKIDAVPDRALSLAYLADLYYKSGELAQGVRTYEASLDLWPDHAEAHYNLGVILGKQGKKDAAQVHYRRTLRLRPHFAPARLNLGLLLAENDQVDEAMAQYREALRVKPDNVQVRYALAQLLAQQGDVRQAMLELETALRLQPAFSAAQRKLGFLLASQGNLAAATARFRKAIELDPDFALAHFDLGQALEQQNDLDGAISHYRHAVRAQPRFGAAHDRLARTLQRRGRHSESLSHFQEAVRLEPQNASVLNALAWLRATSEQAEIRDVAVAVRLAEQACALTNQQDPNMLDTLAAAYAAAGRMNDAIRSAESALRRLAPEGGQDELRREIQRRLESYRRSGS